MQYVLSSVLLVTALQSTVDYDQRLIIEVMVACMCH